jgi:ubiquinol-cytochrome c reductase cytochrome b subunit
MLTWLEERTALPGLWRRFAEHPVPGGPRLRNVLPAVLVYLFVQQGVLGVLLQPLGQRRMGQHRLPQ